MQPIRAPRALTAWLAVLGVSLAAVSCARSSTPAPVTVTATGGVASPARADTGAYLVTLGNDTVAVERYVRTGDMLTVERVGRSPRTAVSRYSMTFGPGGTLTGIQTTAYPPGANTSAPPTQVARASLAGDSATVEFRRGDSTRTARVAASPQAVFAPYASVSVLQLLADRARMAGRDTTVIPLVAPFGAQPGPPPARVIRLRGDSLLFVMPFIEYRAALGPSGQIIGVSAPGSTNKITARRLTSLDPLAFARDWAARDATGAGLGMPSPRDTAEAQLAGGRVMIDYGRPMRRGRTVWGGELVPTDSVWRTGANAATRLTIDRDIVIGGTTVPAGTYTLRTIVSRTGPWKLVINRQITNAQGAPLWGTEYSPEQDLVRVDLQTRRLDQPLEQFTITVEPQGQGGVLRLAWDTTEAFVPFTFR